MCICLANLLRESIPYGILNKNLSYLLVDIRITSFICEVGLISCSNVADKRENLHR
jgi:hypothetical protein